MLAFSSAERRGSWHRLHRNTAIGTPQMRWREMHQSGRVVIMFEIRSSPQLGSQATPLISSSARWRKVVCPLACVSGCPFALFAGAKTKTSCGTGFAPDVTCLGYVGQIDVRRLRRKHVRQSRRLSRCRHHCFHADEPLLRRPHNHGIVAAPAVRVAMFELGRRKQRAMLPQHLCNNLVRFEDR